MEEGLTQNQNIFSLHVYTDVAEPLEKCTNSHSSYLIVMLVCCKTIFFFFSFAFNILCCLKTQ